jgi:hypothetical protein
VAGGAPLAGLVGWTAASTLALLTLPAAVLVRGPRSGAWIGLLMLVAAPNLHTFAWLLALPAMLVVRRELGLIVALLIATYNPILAWVGVACMGWALGAGVRWPILFERGDVPSQSAA